MSGFHGRVLFVDLTAQTHRVETIDPTVYRDYLAGYGLGAWLMWKHFPPGTDPLAPEACFAICSGLLTGMRTPFASRIQIVGKSPSTGTWADSNSIGSVCTHLRAAGYDAMVVTGRAAVPTVLVVRDDEIAFEPAGELWGQEIPPTFDALKQRFGGKRDVGVSAIGPAGEKQQRIASVMNDRYHAFGRQGFGAIYGAKHLKAIVVAGSGEVPIARPAEFNAVCKRINDEYKRDLGLLTRVFAYFIKAKSWLGWMYRMMARLGMKAQTPAAAMRRAFSRRGTTLAVALSVENGDAPIRNWTGVGTKDFTGNLPWTELVNAVTGWGVGDADLLKCGERIQNLRAAFNWREGLKPSDFKPHPRMLGEGDGHLTAGPLRGVRVPLPMLRDDYYAAMHWNRDTGMVSKSRATELGMADLLAGYVKREASPAGD